MRSFCSNPKCDFYKHKCEDHIDYINVRLEDRDGIQRVDRHMYVNRDGYHIFLCAICRSSVMQVVGEAS